MCSFNNLQHPNQLFPFLTEQGLIRIVICITQILVNQVTTCETEAQAVCVGMGTERYLPPTVSNEGVGRLWYVGQRSLQGRKKHLQGEGLIPLRV